MDQYSWGELFLRAREREREREFKWMRWHHTDSSSVTRQAWWKSTKEKNSRTKAYRRLNPHFIWNNNSSLFLLLFFQQENRRKKRRKKVQAWYCTVRWISQTTRRRRFRSRRFAFRQRALPPTKKKKKKTPTDYNLTPYSNSNIYIIITDVYHFSLSPALWAYRFLRSFFPKG